MEINLNYTAETLTHKVLPLTFRQTLTNPKGAILNKPPKNMVIGANIQYL